MQRSRLDCETRRTRLLSTEPAHTADFYTEILGLETVMDHGLIVSVADPANLGCQISFGSHNAGPRS